MGTCMRLVIVILVCVFGVSVQAADRVKLTKAWVRRPPPTLKTTAAYFEIKNLTDKKVQIVGAQMNFAARVEIHDVKIDSDGMMDMVPLKTVELLPKQVETFQPGKKHLMVFGLEEKFHHQKTVELLLRFGDGGVHRAQINVGK